VFVINYGSDAGKLAVIIDVLDQNRAFIDGPSTLTGVPRQTYPLKRLSLTPIKVKISRGARLSTLVKAFTAAKVNEKWAATSIAKKQALKLKRANATDFERFQLAAAKRTRARLVRKELQSLKQAHKIT